MWSSCCRNTRKTCHSKKSQARYGKKNRKGFTFIEVVVAVVLLSTILSAAFVVVNRCMNEIIDSEIHWQAFELARENMERILALENVNEMMEFGISEENPAIQWEVVIEPFYEPVTSRMWIQAVCSSSYIDSKNESQSIQLTNWLTDLTDEEAKKILEQLQKEQAYMSEFSGVPLFDTAEEAWGYAKSMAGAGAADKALLAIEQLEEEFYNSPEYAEAYDYKAGIQLKAINILSGKGKSSRALEVLEDLEEEFPDSDEAYAVSSLKPDLMLDAARQESIYGDPLKAIEWVKQVQQDYPGTSAAKKASSEAPVIMKEAAKNLIRQGDSAGASKVVKNIVNDYGDSDVINDFVDDSGNVDVDKATQKLQEEVDNEPDPRDVQAEGPDDTNTTKKRKGGGYRSDWDEKTKAEWERIMKEFAEMLANR